MNRSVRHLINALVLTFKHLLALSVNARIAIGEWRTLVKYGLRLREFLLVDIVIAKSLRSKDRVSPTARERAG